jgi:succinyl-CoA synthetase beta subunit
MKLFEYQGKELFRKYGIPIPKGKTVSSVDEVLNAVKEIGFPCVLKSQVLVGGRGKAGGIKIVKNNDEATHEAKRLFALKIKDEPVNKILIEEAVNIEKEFYLGITFDRSARTNVVMLSTAGGIDIEEVAQKTPEKIAKAYINPANGIQIYQIRELSYKLLLNEKNISALIPLILDLYILYISADANLVEINPLCLTKEGKFLAADSKIIIEDNSLFRQKELAGLQEGVETNSLEAQAHKKGLAYVALDGNIGIIGNGAGLVMTTMDEVKNAGGAPANFLDIGGGAKREVVSSALEIVLKDEKVKGLFINIFGGITRCDEVALGVIETLNKINTRIPIVVRLAGTNADKAKGIFKDSKVLFGETMQEAAKMVVSLSS